MTKSEAAEILVAFINVRARKFGRTQVTKDFIEEQRSEAKHHGGQIAQASQVCPHWTTIRAAGRRTSPGHRNFRPVQ